MRTTMYAVSSLLVGGATGVMSGVIGHEVARADARGQIGTPAAAMVGTLGVTLGVASLGAGNLFSQLALVGAGTGLVAGGLIGSDW